MDGDIMNGKVVKVKSSNYEFGAQDRYVNILGCFKYIPNGNIYIIYSYFTNIYIVILCNLMHINTSIAFEEISLVLVLRRVVLFFIFIL